MRLTRMQTVNGSGLSHTPGGSAFDAIRRWSRGTEMGLEFTGTANWGDEARSEALSIYESMRDDRFRPLRRLQDLNYFDDPALRELAAETERAIAKLEAEVRGRTQRLS